MKNKEEDIAVIYYQISIRNDNIPTGSKTLKNG